MMVNNQENSNNTIRKKETVSHQDMDELKKLITVDLMEFADKVPVEIIDEKVLSHGKDAAESNSSEFIKEFNIAWAKAIKLTSLDLGLSLYYKMLKSYKNKNKRWKNARPWLTFDSDDNLTRINLDYIEKITLDKLILVLNERPPLSLPNIKRFEKVLGFKNIVKLTGPALDGNMKKYLPIQQNNGFYDMLLNHTRLKNGKIENQILKQISFLETPKGNKLKLVAEKEAPLSMLINNLSDSQVQLLCYIVYLVGDQNNSDKIYLSLDKYCDIKEIAKRTENKNKLMNDLRVLESTQYSFTTKVKGNEIKIGGKCLSIMDDFFINDKHGVGIALGDWVKSLSKNQYSLMDRAFFKYTCDSKHPYLIKMSLKLNEMVRNNLKNGKDLFALKVDNVIELMNVSESTIKAKGFVKAVKDKLDNTLDTIADEEGYFWKYRSGDHLTYKDYKEDYIEFTNKGMLEAYTKYKKSHK